MSEEANKDCCRCLQDAKVAAIKAELAAAAAKADDVLIVFDTKIIIQDNIRKTHTPCKNTVCTLLAQVLKINKYTYTFHIGPFQKSALF